MRCWYILALVFGPFTAEGKNYIRRSHAVIATDGSISQSEDDQPFPDSTSLAESFSMPVYKIYFQLDGKSMCWERETAGCRSSLGDCDISYCNSADPSCECLLVGFRKCSSDNNRFQTHLQLFTETMRFLDGDYPGHTFFWRQLRVKYYDNTEWNDHLRDRGKVLESSLACRSVACNCSSSNYSHFAWDGTRLVHQEDGIQRSVGPSPLRGPGQSILTLRQFNLRLKESKLTAELSHTYHRPTSTTTGTSTEPATTSRTWRSTTTTVATAATATTATMASTTMERLEEDEEVTTSGETEEESSDDQRSDEYESPGAESEDDESKAKQTPNATASTSQRPGAKKPTTTAAKGANATAGTTKATSTTQTTTKGGAESTQASTTTSTQSATKAAKPKTSKKEEKDEDEDEDWEAAAPTTTTTASTTTTTTLFCHCYLNVSWRSEALSMAPTGPLGQHKLRRATVPHAKSAQLGGCRKFCIQDDFVRAAALHKGHKDFCTCYTPQIDLALYDGAKRYEDEETVIGNWNLPKESFHGYTKVVKPIWKSEVVQARAGCPIDGSDCRGYFSRGCDDKPPLGCNNAHRHSPYSTILPLDVRPDDSFYITKACETNDNVILCSNAWLVFDFEERFTLTKIRLWNYNTDEAVRKILVSAGKDLKNLQEAQVFHDISNAEAPEPPADLSMRGKVPKQPHPMTEMTFDVPVTGRFLKIEILQNYGAEGVGFYRAAFEGYKSPFTDFMPFPGKSCGGYELEDLNGNFTLPELFCRALCSSRMDCAAFEVVYSGEHAGRCIFHSNIWIPTKALNDDRDCYVKDNQVVFCRNGLAFQDVCCSSECGVCGGDKCSWRPGGRERCCAGAIRAMRDFCANETDVACRIPRPRRAGTPTLRLTFERNRTEGNESDILPEGLQVSKFQASELSRAGGTAADLTGVNTGIEIKGYQEWFTRTSTFMCWIKPTFARDQTWYFVFRSSGYAMRDPEDGSWAVEFHCKDDKCRLMIWTRQPAGLGAVTTEYKAKWRWETWTHIAVVLRVGGAFPQLYLNGQPEEVEDATTPWSELEDIIYAKNQFLIIGKATQAEQQFDGYIDHFEVYEEILSPQFIRKHYSFVEAVASTGDGDNAMAQQVCLPPIDTTGYVILEGSARRMSFSVEAKCDEANGFGGKAKVTSCSSSTKRYVLSGCLQKEQCPLRMC